MKQYNQRRSRSKQAGFPARRAEPGTAQVAGHTSGTPNGQVIQRRRDWHGKAKKADPAITSGRRRVLYPPDEERRSVEKLSAILDGDYVLMHYGVKQSDLKSFRLPESGKYILMKGAYYASLIYPCQELQRVGGVVMVHGTRFLEDVYLDHVCNHRYLSPDDHHEGGGPSSSHHAPPSAPPVSGGPLTTPPPLPQKGKARKGPKRGGEKELIRALHDAVVAQTTTAMDVHVAQGPDPVTPDNTQTLQHTTMLQRAAAIAEDDQNAPQGGVDEPPPPAPPTGGANPPPPEDGEREDPRRAYIKEIKLREDHLDARKRERTVGESVRMLERSMEIDQIRPDDAAAIRALNVMIRRRQWKRSWWHHVLFVACFVWWAYKAQFTPHMASKYWSLYPEEKPFVWWKTPWQYAYFHWVGVPLILLSPLFISYLMHKFSTVGLKTDLDAHIYTHIQYFNDTPANRRSATSKALDFVHKNYPGWNELTYLAVVEASKWRVFEVLGWEKPVY